MKPLTNLWTFALVLLTTLSCTKEEESNSTLILPRLSLSKLAADASKQSPYDVLHLDGKWKLSVPVDANGGNIGAATTISNSKLAEGYADKYFYTLDAPYSNVVRLWCPVNGATTSPGSGSDHPRVELNEHPLYWYTKAQAGISSAIVGGRMDVVLSIKQFSATGDIIIGQIHGAGTPASGYPFVMVHAMGDSIVAVVKGDTVGNLGTRKFTLLRNVGLGEQISFSIVDSSNNHIYFTAACKGATGKGSWHTAVPANWKTVQVRFQVGNYLQDHDVSAPDNVGSKVNLYSLRVVH